MRHVANPRNVEESARVPVIEHDVRHSPRIEGQGHEIEEVSDATRGNYLSGPGASFSYRMNDSCRIASVRASGVGNVDSILVVQGDWDPLVADPVLDQPSRGPNSAFVRRILNPLGGLGVVRMDDALCVHRDRAVNLRTG